MRIKDQNRASNDGPFGTRKINQVSLVTAAYWRPFRGPLLFISTNRQPTPFVKCAADAVGARVISVLGPCVLALVYD